MFFGATVVISDDEGETEQTYQIVGVDEANASEGLISWISPLAQALLKAREGRRGALCQPLRAARNRGARDQGTPDAGRPCGSVAPPRGRARNSWLLRNPAPIAFSGGAEAHHHLPGRAPPFLVTLLIPGAQPVAGAGYIKRSQDTRLAHRYRGRPSVDRYRRVGNARQPCRDWKSACPGDPRPFLTRQLKFPIAWPMSRMTSRRRSLPGACAARHSLSSGE